MSPLFYVWGGGVNSVIFFIYILVMLYCGCIPKFSFLGWFNCNQSSVVVVVWWCGGFFTGINTALDWIRLTWVVAISLLKLHLTFCQSHFIVMSALSIAIKYVTQPIVHRLFYFRPKPVYCYYLENILFSDNFDLRILYIYYLLYKIHETS